MKPSGSTGTIVNYGNATSPSMGSMPMIDTRIGIGSPTLGAPSLTSAPRMPLLEKITPRHINAGKAIGTAQARGLAVAARSMRKGIDTVTGYANAVGMHFTSTIGTALRFDPQTRKRGGYYLR